MEKELAEKIANICGLEVHEGYSGRGMYGAVTCGVVGDMGVIMKLIIENADEFVDCDRNPIFEDVRGFRTDSMGYDTIIY
jgi:hypothetical protein